jgi:hypothetical protein
LSFLATATSTFFNAVLSEDLNEEFAKRRFSLVKLRFICDLIFAIVVTSIDISVSILSNFT